MGENQNYSKGKEQIFDSGHLDSDGCVHVLCKLWMCNDRQDIMTIYLIHF